MGLWDSMRSTFAGARPDAAPRLGGETAFGESSIYSLKDWPKYNPDVLMTRKGSDVYRKMMIDEQVSAVVRFRRDAIISRGYYFEHKDEERVAVFDAIMRQMRGSFIDSLTALMTAFQHGFALVEKNFEPTTVDGKTWIGLGSLKLKPFESFDFYTDEYSNITRLVQKVGGREVELDINKFIHFVSQPEVDPQYGQSYLRSAYRAWFTKDVVIKLWNIWLERHATGLMWLEPQDDTTITEASPLMTTIKSMMNNIQAKSWLLLPKKLKLNMHNPANNVAYKEAKVSANQDIAKSFLVPNLLGVTEQGDTGSYSQSGTQLKSFFWTLRGDSDRIEECLNEQLFAELGALNFADGDYPRFRWKPYEPERAVELAKTFNELVAGQVLEVTDEDERHIREVLEFPKADVESAARRRVSKPVQAATETGTTLDPSAQPTGEVNADAAAVKQVALNDAQVTSMLEVITAVTSGVLPKTAAIEILQLAFGMQLDKAEAIINVLEVKEVASKPGTPPTPAQVAEPAPKPDTAFTRAVKRVDFAVIDKRSTEITGAAIDQSGEELAAGVAQIKQFVKERKVLDNPDLVVDVAIPTRAFRKLRAKIESRLQDAWELGSTHAQKEISRAKGPDFAKSIPLNEQAAKKFLESRATTMVQDVTESVRKKVQTILYNSIKGSWTLDETLALIDDELNAASLPQLATAIRTVTFEAINEARFSYFTDPALDGFVQALEYSAIIDSRTTDVCRSLDGHVHPTESQVWQEFKPPNHFNCRSLLIPVTELDNWTESDPPRVDPQEGFG